MADIRHIIHRLKIYLKKKNVKFLSFISKDIGTQSDDAHVHPCERQG